MYVPVPDARHRWTDTAVGVTLTIPAQRQWLRLLFGIFWSVLWFAGVVMVGGALVLGVSHGKFREMGFLAIWLMLWLAGGSPVVLGILWQFFGFERIAVSDDAIEIRKSILSMGFTKHYRMSDARNAHTYPVEKRSWLFWGYAEQMQWLLGSAGGIAFEYGPKTIRFGRSLDYAEAAQIVGKLRARYPRLSPS